MEKLTHEQIDEMEAGREMDALVAELVMEWKYRTDLESTWFILELYKKLDNPVFWNGEFGIGYAKSNGWGPFHPSTDIAAAWQVVEKFNSCEITIAKDKSEYVCLLDFAPDMDKWYPAVAPTAPLAICRAALKAVTND